MCDRKSCDCSVVRDLGSGPWAERRSSRPQDEREPSARGGTDDSVPPLLQSHRNWRSSTDTRMTLPRRVEKATSNQAIGEHETHSGLRILRMPMEKESGSTTEPRNFAFMGGLKAW